MSFKKKLSSVYRFFKGKKSEELKIDKYWIQKVSLKRITNRWELFSILCMDNKVLHFGCTDYPIFNPKKNLHIKLGEICRDLRGFDIDIEGIEVLRQYHNGIYYTDFDQVVDESFDICLVPETIEHVANVAEFIKKVGELNCRKFVISAPNCFRDFFNNRYDQDSGVFTEIIHPDHNCWYSPYTLKNVIEKYSCLKVDEIYLSNNDLMVICICSK